MYGVGVFARNNYGGLAYLALVTPSGEIEITLTAVQAPGFIDEVVLASMVTGLDVFSTDIHLQFDVVWRYARLDGLGGGDTPAGHAAAQGDGRRANPGSELSGLFGQRSRCFESCLPLSFGQGPRRPVNLSGHDPTGTSRIHVVANDCATAPVARVAPELTDPNIDNFGGGGGDHRAYFYVNAHVLERDELHVFLPGTGAPPRLRELSSCRKCSRSRHEDHRAAVRQRPEP